MQILKAKVFYFLDDIEPFKGLLLGLFFISVGASIDFGLVASQAGLLAGLVAALVLLKFAVLVVLSRVFKLDGARGMLFFFALAQGGEFAFVLFSMTRSQNVLPPEVVLIPLPPSLRCPWR
jgi:Kef-type K+ transport system membrane component KefB